MPRKLKKNKHKKKSGGRKKTVGRVRKSNGRKQKQSFFKRLIISLSLTLFSVFLLLLVGYYFVLPSVIFNKEEIKNILIVSDSLDDNNKYISLAHISPNHDENLIIFINGEEVIDVSGGYGEYNLNTIYQLLKIDNKSDQKVKSIFSNILNIAIDDVVITGGIDDGDIENRELKKLFATNILRKINGSISNNINLLKLHLLANSMEIFNYDSVSDVEKVFYKLSTLEEEIYKNCSVSVVNTTSKNGLAQQVTNIIENTGAQVVQVEGSDLMFEKTTIYFPTDEVECKQLVDKILGIFPSEVLLESSDKLPSTQKFRSDVVVLIGEDY